MVLPLAVWAWAYCPTVFLLDILLRHFVLNLQIRKLQLISRASHSPPKGVYRRFSSSLNTPDLVDERAAAALFAALLGLSIWTLISTDVCTAACCATVVAMITAVIRASSAKTVSECRMKRALCDPGKPGFAEPGKLGSFAGSRRVISRTAEVRAASPAHKPSTPVPIGVTAPTPVITTRRCPFLTSAPLP